LRIKFHVIPSLEQNKFDVGFDHVTRLAMRTNILAPGTQTTSVHGDAAEALIGNARSTQVFPPSSDVLTVLYEPLTPPTATSLRSFGEYAIAARGRLDN
jgi:hypothetical protein